MQDNIKIFKNSIILYVRLLITSIIYLFTSRFVIQSLGASDFGLYSVVGSIVVLMVFFNTVMTSTTYRYIAFEMGKGSNGDVKKVFNISLVIHACLAVIVVIFAAILGEFYIHHYLNVETGKVSDAIFVFRFSILATVFSIMSIPYQGLITAQEKFLVQAAIEVIRSTLGLGAAIILIYYLGNRLRLYAVLTAIVMMVPPLLFFLYSRVKYTEIIQWSFQRDINKYKEMIGFSGWIMIGAGASIGKVQGSALIINSFFGTILNAAFAIANQVNSIVVMFAQSLGQAAIPQITKSYSSGNTNRAMTLVAYISKYTCFLMLMPALPILLETDFLLTLWLGDLPQYTVIFCQLMIFNALIDSISSGIPAIVHATGKIKYFQIILSTTSLLSLPIAYFLFKSGYSPSSILVAFISTAIINVVVRQLLLKNLINFDVISFLRTAYLRIFYVSILVVPLFFIRDIFPEGLSRFIIYSIFSICWLLAAIYFVGIESKERSMIRNVFKKLN